MALTKKLIIAIGVTVGVLFLLLCWRLHANRRRPNAKSTTSNPSFPLTSTSSLFPASGASLSLPPPAVARNSSPRRISRREEYRRELAVGDRLALEELGRMRQRWREEDEAAERAVAASRVLELQGAGEGYDTERGRAARRWRMEIRQQRGRGEIDGQEYLRLVREREGVGNDGVGGGSRLGREPAAAAAGGGRAAVYREVDEGDTAPPPTYEDALRGGDRVVLP